MTEEQFQAWKHAEANKPFFAFLTMVREGLKEAWAEGQPITDKDHAIAIVYGDILALNYERDVKPYYERTDEDEQERNQAD